jgi:hypothetical protein
MTLSILVYWRYISMPGTPTILFEAGHFKMITRKKLENLLFVSLLSEGLLHFAENDIVVNRIDDYLNIPQNKVVLYDLMYKG